MKKVISLALALMICLVAVTAMAEDGSKSLRNMTTFSVNSIEAETLTKTVQNQSIAPVSAESMTPEVTAVYTKELEKLDKSESVVKYFGEVKDAEGNVVSLTEKLGTDDLKVNELWPVEASDFVAGEGATVTLKFATPYEEGDEVLVLIGVVDGETVTWTAFDGVVTAEGIEVSFNAATIEAIQNGVALMAIVSK